MSYTINLTDGTIFAVVADGTINTASSMTLVGQNYAGYGAFLDSNFIHLLENSSNTTPPGAPLTGQLWWDSGNNLLKVYNGSAFKPMSSNTASGSAPTGNVTGDLWFNTSTQQLNVWTGSTWLVVGPGSNTPGGTTGAVATAILDNIGGTHYVVELYSAGTIVGMISKDPLFSPATPIAGFSGGVYPGLTMSTATPLMTGTATNAQALNSLTSTQFMRSDANTATSGSITVNSSAAATAIFNGASAGVGNIGTSGTPFNTIFATATAAEYADVAERFAADTELSPGTVVELGGSAEITQVTADLSENVFGVISTRAAYLMNSRAGSDATHPPVAMTGRVPVRTIGQVRKGDRLVSAGNGLARSALPGEATAFNVIGRALADKLDSGESTIEAIVTIN
jgi:hypothetical protein